MIESVVALAGESFLIQMYDLMIKTKTYLDNDAYDDDQNDIKIELEDDIKYDNKDKKQRRNSKKRNSLLGQNKYIEAFKAEMLQTQDSNGLAEEHVVITDEERHNMEFGELLLLFSDLVRWEFALNDREYPIIKRKKKWQCPMIYGVLLGMLNDKLKLNVEKFKQKDEDNNNENNENAMGVFGGMGDNAPVEDDNMDNDSDINDENNNNNDRQLSDIYGDDQQQMIQNDNKGEWKPMNKQIENNNKNKKDNNNEKNKEINDKTNPFRSLGDALSEWKQRLDIIEQNENIEKEERIADNNNNNNEDGNGNDNEDINADEYAHIPEDMNVENETQGLMDKREDDNIMHLPNITDINNNIDDMNDENINDNEFENENEFEHDDKKINPYEEQQKGNHENDNNNKNDINSKQNELKLKDLQIENDNDEETK
eukprot:160019_1